MLTLDHLAVLGTSLAAAQAHAEAALGRVLRPGGRHPHFATHNALLGLEAGLYLEAIAIDPDAKAPGYPRWFGLDDFTGAPRFDKWICRVDDLDAALQALPVAGQPVALSRGDLRWRMAVPGDGRLPWVGLFPALIEWQTAPIPGDTLSEPGLRLDRLTVTHPEAGALQDLLAPYLADPRVGFEAGAAGPRARFATPEGEKVLT